MNINEEKEKETKPRAKNGDGNLSKSDDGLYKLYKRFTDSTGKRIRKAFYSRSKTEVFDKAKEYAEKLNGNKYITVRELSLEWLGFIKNSIRTRTMDNYKGSLRQHIYPAIGDMYAKDVSAVILQKLFDSMAAKGYSAKTVITVRTHLKAMLNYALEEGYVDKNFAKRTKPPHTAPKEIVALNEEQVEHLLAIAKEMSSEKADKEETEYLNACYFGVVAIAFYSSARKGEILGLSWDAVNFEESTIGIRQSLSSSESGTRLTEPKTKNSRRTILMPPVAMEILRKWKEVQAKYAKKYDGLFENTHNLVFTNSSGNFVDMQNLNNRYWRILLKRSCMPIGFTFHGLRHSGASILLKRGVNIKVVSERLGHSSVTVTWNVYQHLLPGMQETAVKELKEIFKEENENGKQ